MNPPNKRRLLEQIAAIPVMERGKLSHYTFKERSNTSGPYHKLQRWQDGKNHTRYVSADELPAVQTALAGYVAAHPSVRPADAPLIPQFDQLIRNVDDDKQAVSTLQQKLDDTKLTNAAVGQLDTTVLKVIDPPRTIGGRLTSLPRKQMAIAAIASLALAVAVLVIMVWSDRSAREPKDIESRLGIPVVATINDLALIGAADG